ncbi:APC family permease [Salinisphaera hydrothermalis]|uniref:Amino acid transporter n=1 Tax=Salinisphaera hydrothermalis (strain C41B8) TaxID=1304275 RepID=A0A084IH72_SALHC|nr:APC family permease [Salinisphaera hydrothermalis]KEZ76056.1 amino acid transporter [Salinisphaera hydrothermalis C41B8]
MSNDSTTLATRLSLTSVVLFGLAYMAPAIVMLMFGVIASTSHGTASTAYLVATLAMLFTALSYGKMARISPVSGSAYSYARNMLGGHIGFLVGWAILLDYFFLPMVAWLIQSLYLNAQFPGIPIWGWLLVNIGLTTLINGLGIVLADWVNRGLMLLTVAGIAAFVFMCVHFLGHAPTAPAVDFAPFWNEHSTFAAVTAAAAIAAYSFLGFDAVTTLSEETVDAGRTVPRAIVLIVLIGGVLFVTVSFIMQLVHPGSVFDNESTASYGMSVRIGGQAFADLINSAVIVGGFASGLAIQTSTSRLLYVMGRDGVLPRRFFGYLHPKFKTPLFNLILVGVASLGSLGLSLDTATSFINFGAFLAFTMVNVCVLAYYLRQRATQRLSVFGYAVLPTIGALVDIGLLTQLNWTAIGLGLAWLTLGIAYLAALTGGFRRQPPETDLAVA